MIGCSRYTAIITWNSRKYIQLHHDSKHPPPGGGEKFPFPLKTDLICWFVPPEVALRMAQAASFLVLYSAPEFSRSANIGNMLQSITACNQRSKLSNSSLSQQPIKSWHRTRWQDIIFLSLSLPLLINKQLCSTCVHWLMWYRICIEV